MSEADAIASPAGPVSVTSLSADLTALGLRHGDVAFVHSSLSALGWVCGGAVAVIEALLAVLGPEGTLAMPAFSGGLSEPSLWQHPPVPAEWWPAIRATMPAFDRSTTPTRGIGAAAELFRTWPGALRSDHPTSSVAALGSHAEELVAAHPLDDPLGEASPLGRLYALNARVLLLGVGHGNNTSLHLAERKAFGDHQELAQTGSPVVREGERLWVTYTEPLALTDDFEALGAAFEAVPGQVACGHVGAGLGRLMDQRALVDFGAEWLARHRDARGRPALG
jgi:aminoglycoside 3-N-acetyltransferase